MLGAGATAAGAVTVPLAFKAPGAAAATAALASGLKLGEGVARVYTGYNTLKTGRQ